MVFRGTFRGSAVKIPEVKMPYAKMPEVKNAIGNNVIGKNARDKNIALDKAIISQQKHMLWVLIRSVLLRRFK